MARSQLTVVLLGALATSATALVAGPKMSPAAYHHHHVRSSAPVASAKILPVAYAGMGAGLLLKSTSAGAIADKALLASTGLLSVLNLALTDNERYAGAKKSVKIYDGRESLPFAAEKQRMVAKKWYNIVRLHTLGQVVSLAWILSASADPTAALRCAAGFMGANVLFFALGAGPAKHDKDGLPAPMSGKLLKFVFTTDVVLFLGALMGALSPAGTASRAVGASLFIFGCLIGAVEGAPKVVTTLKAAFS